MLQYIEEIQIVRNEAAFFTDDQEAIRRTTLAAMSIHPPMGWTEAVS